MAVAHVNRSRKHGVVRCETRAGASALRMHRNGAHPDMKGRPLTRSPGEGAGALRRAVQGEWDWPWEHTRKRCHVEDAAWRRHGEVPAQHMATCTRSRLGRWDVGLDANAGSGWVGTRGKCPAKGFVWQALAISKKENQQDQTASLKKHSASYREQELA